MQLSGNITSRETLFQRMIHRFPSLAKSFLHFIRHNKSLSLGLLIFAVIFLMALFPDILSPYHYTERHDDCGPEYPGCRYAPPMSNHPLGTNLLGYDMLSRVIYGSQIALIMAFSATILALLIGVPLGIISGYFGGVIDRILTFLADTIYAFPSLLISIALAIYLTAFAEIKVIAAVAFGTAIVYVPAYFRVIRSQVLQIKEETFIEAARSIGAGHWTIILRYVVPNVMTSPIALIPFNMTDAILTNAGLAFLGLGIQPPTPDWGYDVYDNKSLVKIRRYPWLIFFPSLMIFLLSFSLSLIGDALNDKFNPYLKRKNNQ